MNKSLMGLIGSSALTVFGMILRLSAHAIAWPQSYGFSGSRADTEWAHQEEAISQVGLILMCIGGFLLVVTYLHWLFAGESNKKSKGEDVS